MAKKRKPEPMHVEQTIQRAARASDRLPSPLVKTSILFVTFMCIFHGSLWLLLLQGREPLTAETTQIVSWLLSAAGIANRIVNFTHIMMNNAHWVITPECSGTTVYFLFVSFVLAYKASSRSKVLALAAGIPFICVVNFSRLFLLGLLTEWYPRYARDFHDYVWQVVFVVMVVAMWLVWIELVVNREAHSSVPE